MRVNKMITKEKNALICYLTLSTTFLRKCMKISMENLYVDIGASRVKNNGKLENCQAKYWSRTLTKSSNYMARFWYFGLYRGASRGRVQAVRTPSPRPEMTSGFLIHLVFCQKKKLCGLLVLK